MLSMVSDGHLISHLYMYKFACADKFVLSTFSINSVIKDMDWCLAIELLLQIFIS